MSYFSEVIIFVHQKSINVRWSDKQIKRRYQRTWTFKTRNSLSYFIANAGNDIRCFGLKKGSSWTYLGEQGWHKCVPGWFLDPASLCGLRLLFALYPAAPRGFSLGTSVFPSPQKPTFPNSNSIWIIVKHFIMPVSLWLGWYRKHSLCLMLNLHFTFFYGKTPCKACWVKAGLLLMFSSLNWNKYLMHLRIHSTQHHYWSVPRGFVSDTQ